MISENLSKLSEEITSAKASGLVAVSTIASSIAGMTTAIQAWVNILGTTAGLILSVILIRYWIKKDRMESATHKLETRKLQLELDEMKANSKKAS